MSLHRSMFWLAMILLACSPLQAAPETQTGMIGVAKVDITPDCPVRMYGYESRKAESAGVAGRLKAAALAIGGDEGDGPAVLLTVDNGSVPAEIRAEVLRRLQRKTRLKPERLMLCNAHIHSGPDLFEMSSYSGEQYEHLVRYKKELTDRLEEVVLKALASRTPGRLDWTQGSVSFAGNRRTLKDGKWVNFGKFNDGPVEHSLPLLRATDAQGKLLAVVLNYACHNTTLRQNFPQLHGDWAGCAQEFIEADHPGAVALVAIGCGADQDPYPNGTVELCQRHGRAVADEVKRLLTGPMKSVEPRVAARATSFEVAYEQPIPMDRLQAFAKKSYPGQSLVAQLKRGEKPPTAEKYEVAAWAFGDDLAMVFLNNEVVVDYVLRMKRQFDGSRLWVNAYTNDVSFYIPSNRLLKEGGYEVNNSLDAAVTYGQPERVQPSLEERIIDGVRQVLPESYRTPRQATAAPVAASAAQIGPIGVAKVDITPETPVRMYGYAIRTNESEGVAQRLKATALAIGSDEGDGPAVLLSVDSGSVPANIREEVLRRVQAKTVLKPERFMLCNAHIHSGPDLKGMNRMSGEHREHLVRYEKDLTDRLEEAVLKALASRKPGRLDWTQGSVGFAVNRRLLKDGKWANFGAVRDAPVDQSVPLLRATDESGKLLAVVVNYACHNTTLGEYYHKLHADWCGCAQEFIEADHPGAVALITIGCGADANPYPRYDRGDNDELCRQHGRAMADEVKRLLAGPFKPVDPKVAARSTLLEIPYEQPADLEQLREDAKKSPAAKRLVARLERGEKLPTAESYQIATWAFGNDLAMVFLADEVVVDYALRMKREFDGSRLWISAYTNDVSYYVPSSRLLKEGGYEVTSSVNAMVTFGHPERLQPPLEDRIVEGVRQLLPENYRSPAGNRIIDR